MHPRERAIYCISCERRQVAVLVEFAHADFVNAEHSAFVELAHNIAWQIARTNPQSPAELLRGLYLNRPTTSVETALNEVGRLLGDTITLTRFIRWSTEPLPGLPPAVAVRQERP